MAKKVVTTPKRIDKREITLEEKLRANIKIAQELEVERNIMLEKGLSSNSPQDLITATSFLNSKQRVKSKSYLFDPYINSDTLGYKNKPFQLSYDTLRAMGRTNIVKAIVTTRIEQVVSFSEPQDDSQKIGWGIRKKRKIMLKNDVELTDSEKYEIEGIINFIQNCGIDENKFLKDDYEGFLRKVTRDSLTLDQMTFEVQRNRGGLPIEFFATDASTYRLAESYNNIKVRPEQLIINGHAPSYVQLYQGLINAEFYPWELCFGTRNPSTSIWNNGYGVSELEDMIKIVTWMLNGDQYNGNFFSQGSNPKGFFSVKGNLDDDKISEFKQAWRSQVAGVGNSHKVPILGGDGLEVMWNDMQKSNTDMEFGVWQEYLLKLGCAQYKIDPSEIGFHLNGGVQPAVYQGDNLIQKIKYSQDKGLYPLLRFLGRKMNQLIVGPISNYKYEYYWTGIAEDTENIELDNDIKKLSNFMGLKEVRLKYKLPAKIDDDDIIMNSAWIQNKQMAMNGGGDSNQMINSMNGEGGEGEGGSQQFNNMFSKDNPFAENGNSSPNDDENPFMKDLSLYMEDTIRKSKEG